MGMFDTFIIEVDSKEYALQSKQFYSTLAIYRIGDVVDGAYASTHCYFHPLYFDNSKCSVNQKDKWVERHYVFLTISTGIYCDFIIQPWLENTADIHNVILSQSAKWQDQSRVLNLAIYTPPQCLDQFYKKLRYNPFT